MYKYMTHKKILKGESKGRAVSPEDRICCSKNVERNQALKN